MPRSRYRVMHEQSPNFLTMTVNNWLPVFTRTETVQVIYDSWRFLQQQADFKLYSLCHTGKSLALQSGFEQFKP